jgi:hypothetical protein
MHDFQQFCSLPAVAGVIDWTHIYIFANRIVGPKDYFYFKSSSYTTQMQAVVDHWKRFTNLAVGMPRNTHDSRMLCRLALNLHAQSATLFEDGVNVDGFIPYLLGNGSYPLKS